MKIYVVTYGTGELIAAGTDEKSVRDVGEALFQEATEVEWRPDFGRDRLYYRYTGPDYSGRWSSVPAVYCGAVEEAKVRGQ